MRITRSGGISTGTVAETPHVKMRSFFMTKKHDFNTLTQQVTKLKQRGLAINDDEKAKRYLLTTARKIWV